MSAEPSGPAWEAACLETNWLVYKLVPKNGTKLDKHPANPRTGQTPISVHDAACLTRDQAKEALGRLKGRYGIGYLPRPGSALIGTDLDHSIEGGAIKPWAKRLIDLGASWAERSPSGTGIRMIGARKHSIATEIDSEKNGVGIFSGGGRFFTVTGDLIEGRKPVICSIPAVVREIMSRLNGSGHPAAEFLDQVGSKADSSRPRDNSDSPHWFANLSQSQQLQEVERMLGHLNDPKFAIYDEWLRISFAVHAATDSMGFDIWDRWCQRHDGYNYAENRKKWDRGFSTARAKMATAGTLIYEARAYGYEPPKDAFRPSEEHAVKLSEILSRQEPEPPEPEPSPIDLNAPAFYGELGEMVRTVDPLTEADPYGILAATLVMLGNWIGRRYHLRIGADRHYAAQQVILTGQSALSRKGTACNIAKAAMQVFDEDWSRDNVFYSLNSGQGIAHTVAKRNEVASQTNANGDKRALFITEEFADVLRKSQQKDNTILQVLRLAWDGSILENTSITHPIRVHGATVSLIGMITEAELRQLLDPAELATGSYNRMNFVIVNRSKELPGHPPEITEQHFKAMRQIRRQIEELPRQYAIAPDCISAPVKLSARALEMSIEIKKRWETEGANLVEQANSRAFMHVLRYALIYAVADGHNSIGTAHLEAAEHLVARMADGVRRQATAELSDKVAQRILTHMREDPTEALSRTGISCQVFSRHVQARDLENAISTLSNLGLIQACRVITSGRPRTMYALTPDAK